MENDADAAAESTDPNQHVEELARHQGAILGLFNSGSSNLQLQSIRVKHWTQKE